MKLTIITCFAATTALIAAETNSSAPAPTTNGVTVLRVDLVEQARLVTEIGQEAAKGFDVEAHARSLRSQIEALLTKPVAKPAAPAEPTEKAMPQLKTVAKPTVVGPPTPAATTAPNTSATGPDPAVLREAIRILRAKADELEAQLENLSRKP